MAVNRRRSQRMRASSRNKGLLVAGLAISIPATIGFAVTALGTRAKALLQPSPVQRTALSQIYVISLASFLPSEQIKMDFVHPPRDGLDLPDPSIFANHEGEAFLAYEGIQLLNMKTALESGHGPIDRFTLAFRGLSSFRDANLTVGFVE